MLHPPLQVPVESEQTSPSCSEPCTRLAEADLRRRIWRSLHRRFYEGNVKNGEVSDGLTHIEPRGGGGKFTPRPTFCCITPEPQQILKIRWLFPKFCPAHDCVTFFLIWRHHLTWWRHLDIALSRISWRFFRFSYFFQGKHKKLQILEVIYMFSRAGNLMVTSTQS